MTGFVLSEEAYPVIHDEMDLDAPHWAGARVGELRIQRCKSCGGFQWGPDIICHHCHSFDLGYEAVPPRGTIFSWHRSWRPSHPSLASHVPFIVAIVSLEVAPKVLVIGNLVGDQHRKVNIGAAVEAVFEHHEQYSLIQWREVAG